MKLNNVTAKIEHWNLKKLTKIMSLLAVAIGLVVFWVWYQNVYLSSERRFWMAINNSMATPSVVRTLNEGGSGNQVVQKYRFHYVPQTIIENNVYYNQKSATTETLVETEGVITPTEQYLRYTQFNNNGVKDLIAEDNTSLLGQWASGGETQPTADDAKLNYMSEQVSLAVFGNFSPKFRQTIINSLKNNKVYGNSLAEAKKDKRNGRDVLEYQIEVKLRDYVKLLQDSFYESGLGEFPPLALENYREDSTVNGTIIVDKSTNSIAVVDFGGRTEEYSNYGVLKEVVKPTAKYTIDELQAKVQASVQSSL